MENDTLQNLKIDNSSIHNLNAEKNGKFDMKMISILVCHIINSIISIFSNTFLVANLYKTNTNPILTIAGYHLITYVVICFFYYFLAHFTGKVKIREWIYRGGIALKCLFIFLIVLLNDSFQDYIVLFAIISGMGDSFYWSTYTLMRYSIVRRHMVNKFTLMEQILHKLANIIFPVILGSMIDINSFVKVAIPVLFFALIQVVFSFFVKSNELKQTKFDLVSYWKKIIKNKDTKQFAKIYFSFTADGLRAGITTTITIFIMHLFNGSNTSLGIISSIIAVSSMICILIYSNIKKIGENDLTYFLLCILPFIACVLIVAYPSRLTLILYNICFNITSDILTYGFDSRRISIVKLLKYHSETSEHNITSEFFLDLGRIPSYLLMLYVGLKGGDFIFGLRLLLIFYITSFVIANMFNYSLFKDYQRILARHNKEKNSKNK